MAVSTNTEGGFFKLCLAALTTAGMYVIREAASRIALDFSTVDCVRIMNTLSVMYSFQTRASSP